MNASALDQLVIVMDPPAQAVLAVALIIMMYAISLGLRVEHFAFLRSDPKHFFGGLAAQIIGLPVVTIMLASILQPPPSIALGMIVIAACPGGNVSNFMSYAARGDTAYSVALTAGSSIIATLWTPAAILLWSDLYPPTSELLDTIEFNRASFVLQTTLLLAAPLTAGMVTAWLRRDFAERVRKPLALFGAFLLAGVVIHGTIDFWPVLIASWALIMGPVILHNAVAFGFGAGVGRLLGASIARRRSLTIEVGIQNTGLAIVVIIAQLQGLGGAAAIAAVWGVWHLFSGGAMVGLYRYLDHRMERLKRYELRR